MILEDMQRKSFHTRQNDGFKSHIEELKSTVKSVHLPICLASAMLYSGITDCCIKLNVNYVSPLQHLAFL